MGCGESKIKSINLAQDPIETENHVTRPSTRLADNLDDGLPNRLLAAIPISDLGESLDSRHLSESFNGANHLGKSHTVSMDSGDSGYDEYEEEYSHIITENSSAELVKKVEEDFRPVDLPELLVITGRACTRILSGYQKTKVDEAKILDALRDEGLLAKPKIKTNGGLSFEVVDAAVVEKKTAVEGDAFISSEFMPSKTLKKLELRRGALRKPTQQLEVKLAEAELRRKELEEEKVKSVLERSGLERHGRMRSASAMRRENLYSATVAKRQQQLQEMRDKLKEKHKKNDMIKLKKQLNTSGSSLMDSGYRMEALAAGANYGGGAMDFFDD